MVKKSLLWIYRATLLLLWLIIIVLASSILALRYLVLPNIENYKDQIATHASNAAGQKITIGNIDASWDGLNPHLSLLNIQVYDAENRPALTLNHIETSLSWLSIPLMEPRLSAIVIDKPELTIRREADGTVFLAGILMGGKARPEFPNWLLRQSRIDVVDATVLWQDDMRQAPPLTLEKLNLQISSPAWESLIGHHRFGLTATPSAGSSSPIDLRGNIYGRNVSQLKNWQGTIYGKVEGTDISAWQHWISYPFNLKEGYGAAQFWMDFDNGKVQNVTSDVVLNNVKTQLPHNQNEASLNNLSGRIVWTQYSDGQGLRGEHIKLATDSGLNMRNGKIGIRERLNNGKQIIEGDIALDEIKLESLATFTNYLPISPEISKQLAEITPEGKLTSLEMSWKGDEGIPDEYSIRSQFTKLGMRPYEKIPGFSNLSGTIDANQDSGSLTINAQQVALEFEKVLRWPIPAEKLTGQINWHHNKGKTEVRVSNLSIVNQHLSGSINASYTHNGIKGGYLDLTAKLGNADAKYAHYYFPKILNEETMRWLDTSILAGHGEDINVVVKGNLEDFPYVDKKLGLFKVTSKITNGQLEYGAGWPKIDGITLDMLFEADHMDLNVTGGSIFGNQINKARISIPALDSHQPILNVVGELTGPVNEGIRFINNSPVLNITKGFTENMQATGNGKLNLELHIPLHDIDSTKIKGAYQVSNGSLSDENIPALTQLNGRLEFTESSLRAQNINTYAYGGPAQFTLNTGKDHILHINAKGRATDTGLRQAFGAGFTDRLSGAADWAGSINIFEKQLDMSISSNLYGMASNLPAPLNKPTNEIMPLRIDKRQSTSNQDSINATLGSLLSAKILRTNQNGVMKIDRGEIAINTTAELPNQTGISMRGSLDHLDLDEWKNILDKSASGSGASGFNLSKVDLSINSMDVFDRRINNLKLVGKPVSDGWQVNIQSKEVTGDAQWHNQNKGKVTAKLKNLTIPAASPGTMELRTQGDFKQQTQAYPALDITADNFEFGKKKLGRLELIASQQDDDWSIEKLRIITPESTLNAEGEWHNWKHTPNTRINLTWDITDLGKTLERFGYANTIKAGEASLSGQLKWPGSPHEFDYPELSGNLQLDARKGQILKIQPGVGRLFSVLSLQNLPRRLTLDFRDVFSSGFTFDKINSSVKIDRGVMRSDDFKMEGPTAKVEMRGETDLQKETQHLNIKVTPYISDSLSLAALAGGPVVGAAAYIAQKLLKDPINKLAADEYEITGTWDNPVDVKNDNAKTKQPSPSSNPLGR